MRDYRAGYKQSIHVLETVKKVKPTLITKTSLMLGLGEKDDDIKQALEDFRKADIDVVTFGQYLRPTLRHISVQRYIEPSEFENWKTYAENLGFKYVASGPLVRSSYRAGEFYLKSLLEAKQQQSSQ